MRLNAIVVGGLFAGMLAGAAPATAQIGIGLIGGVSISNLHGSEKDDLFLNAERSSRTGFVGGGFINLGLGGLISIRPEVLYVQKGVRFSDSSGEVGFNLDYIEIPVLFVVGIPAGALKVEFFAGPQVAFQTKCDVTGEPSGGPGETRACDDPAVQAEIESTDFGVLVGGGVVIGSFMAQVAIDYGLTTIDAETDPFDIKTQAIYAMVGWMFRLP